MRAAAAAAEIDGVMWSLPASIWLFALACTLITAFGVFMTVVAERLARRTGLGEAMMGALFIGAATSLSEIVTSTTAAAAGHAELAVSNAIGSIAGQTAFLAVADMAYRKVNLEHAAASAENLMLGAFLTVLLALPLLAIPMPRFAVLGIHPVTLVLFLGYGFGMRLVSQTRKRPMWHPRLTRETARERKSTRARAEASLEFLWLQFGLCAAMVAIGGWVLARAGIAISHHSGLSETLVGGLLTALASSLPELVTAVTAVRLGALTLAVGDVLGGNAFDVVIVGFADLAYREGSIYAALSGQQVFLLALALLLTGILLLGMLHREKHGIANIGLESFLVLIFYLAGFAALAFSG